MTTETKHTPEPWETPGEDGGERVIAYRDARGKLRTLAHVYDGMGGSMEANARRIVACVNACAGLSTEYLEADRLHVADVNGEAVRLISEQADVWRVQRDSLAAALRNLTATARTFRNVPKGEQEWTPIDDEALNAAFAALAKVQP